MAIYLTNRLSNQIDIEALGYTKSVAKPAIIDNGPVLWSAVKPITPWSRHFFDGEVSSVSGERVCTWRDGNVTKSVVTTPGTGLSSENLRRWLPGVGGDWDTRNVYTPLWRDSTIGIASFDSLRLRTVAEAKTAGWDLGTLYAERRKTLELIKVLGPAVLRQAKRVLQSLKSADEAKRFLKQRGEDGAASWWLLDRYGVRPIFFDLISAYERLTRIHEELFRVVEMDWKSEQKQVSFDPGSISGFMTPSNYSHTGGQPASPIPGKGTSTTLRNYSARCGIGVKAMMNGKFTINPALTGWEMVPFSFVADWVLNIGDNILAWAPVVDRSLEYAWMTIRQDIHVSTTADFSGVNLFAGLAKPKSASAYYIGRTLSTVKCKSDIYAHTLSRVPLDLADIPYGLSSRFNLDWAKVADIAALMSANRSSWQKVLSRINF